ncbi:adenylate/guanylate cyclase domain-containing protein [Nocardioides sp. AE5]|uniref:adenylate/guanylate cyclase domain-containing protein n=1 Tax=Nocardioides sp. AE5 TaxID=2962573 RepID=UPI002880EDB9|nr:adenylate/guanylate cyclase domain-containing protein [Nocardioides sp. AE5]MDT0200877.1 adenylate/guanylate cyclase domain-containing protein [Nocardioides sp. AE5]
MVDASGADEATAAPEAVGPDPELFAALEATLLGQAPHLTRPEVLERAGVSFEHAHGLWLSLGFPPPESDESRVFTDADVEAIRMLGGLIDGGLVDSRLEFALTRSMGRSFARLAEWEIAEVGAAVLASDEALALDRVDAIVEAALPTLEKLQNYVWRRHLAAAAGRLLLQATTEESTLMAVGFADIVGYTRRTRSLDAEELGEMVEHFEEGVNLLIAEHGARIIKTIGDEVLFVCDDPVAAARLGLALVMAHEEDEEFPEIRVGMAHGQVLSRLGDVFGEVVNIAARLTSLARPGRILINRDLADLVRAHDEEFRVRRAPSRPVKGYSRLETWALKQPKKPRGVG